MNKQILKNKYSICPIRFQIINPFNQKVQHEYFAVSKLPNKIMKILNNRSDENASKKLIKNIYGKYADYLYHNIKGSDEKSNLSISDTDLLIDSIIKTDDTKSIINKYSDITFYDEDNIDDIRNKIQLITGIETWRQHIYWKVQNNTQTTYSIMLDNNIYEIDMINQIYNNKIPKLDIIMLNNKNNYYIENNEIFTTLKKISVNFDDPLTFYIIDFMDIFNTNIQSFINSSYIERFYYGFVLKYYPWINLDIFNNLIVDIHSINKYNLLVQNSNDLKMRYNDEYEIYKAIYYIKSSQVNKIKFSQFITKSQLLVKYNNRINHRILFDLFITNPTYFFVRSYLNNNNITSVDKIHKGKKIPIIPKSINNGSVFVYDFIKPNENNCLIIFHITNYYYKIYTNWKDEDKVTFLSNIELISKSVNKLINMINKFKNKINLVDDVILINQQNVEFVNINVTFIWHKIIHIKDFDELKKKWKKYENSNIIQIKQLASTDLFNLAFIKGITSHNKKSIKKITIGLNNT